MPEKEPEIITEGGHFYNLRKIYRQLYAQVFFAIICGIIIGHFWPHLGESLKPLGDAFIKMVKMIIAPVIFLTLVNGIAGMADLRKVGRVAAKAFAYFFTFSTLALIIGLIIGNVLQPGHGLHINPAAISESARDAASHFTEQAKDISFIAFLLNIIPATVVSAFVSGNILQVLFFSVLFGIALSASGEAGRPVLNFIQALIKPIFKLISMIMRTAPIGAFGAMAFTIGAFGIGSIASLAYLIFSFYLAAFIFISVILGLVCRRCGFSIFALLRYLKAELLLVFGTSSSESALPSLMQKMEQAGAKRSVVGLVVPTGYSFNLDGTNMYMTLTALFIAQALDIHLSFGQQLLIVVVAMLSSKGAAGVPGAGFIALAATLQVVPALPAAGMALILGIDRFMDICRSLTNIIGNAVACVVVAKWENELDTEQLRKTLSAKG